MRAKRLLVATVLVGTLGTAGMLPAPSADACEYFPPASGTAVPSSIMGTAAAGTTCGSSIALSGSAPLFNKIEPGDPNQTGIGLVGTPENEVGVGQFIQVGLAGVLNAAGAVSAIGPLSITVGSVQAGETWELRGSNTGGVLPADSVLASGGSTTSNVRESFNNPSNFQFAYLTATAGNVLLDHFDSPEQGVPGVPEPASLALLGAGLFGFGLLRHRRKRVINSGG